MIACHFSEASEEKTTAFTWERDGTEGVEQHSLALDLWFLRAH